MTKFMNPSFSSGANSQKFKNNWNKAFGKDKLCCSHKDGCENKPIEGRRWCLYHFELEGIEVEKPETD